METKSLLLGESATDEQVDAIATALAGADGVDADHPHEDDAPRPGGAAGRREDRGAPGCVRGPDLARPSTWPRRASGRPYRSPGSSISNLTSIAARRSPRTRCRRPAESWSCWKIRSAPTRGARGRRSRPCRAGPTPTPGPEAELWMGAHPDSPSRIARRPRDVDGRRPRRSGRPARRGDGGAVRRPAAVHAEGARRADAAVAAGASGQRAGRPPVRRGGRAAARADRLYTDPYAKPELLVAIDDFDTLCGFRDPAMSATVIDGLDVPALAPVVAGAAHPAAVEAAACAAPSRRCCAGRPDRCAAVVVGRGRQRPPRRGLDYIADLGRTASRATWASSSRCCSTTSSCSRTRRSGCRPATCTPTCAAPAWRCWRRATTCCAAA